MWKQWSLKISTFRQMLKRAVFRFSTMESGKNQMEIFLTN